MVMVMVCHSVVMVWYGYGIGIYPILSEDLEDVGEYMSCRWRDLKN